MKTPYFKKEDTKITWILIDAKNLVIGRLSVFIANHLRGKDSPLYTPSIVPQNKVIVVNSNLAKFTGNKMEDKVYYHHTGYMGGIKGVTAEKILEKDSTQLIREAVRRMLPDNKLRKEFMRNLYVFPTATHKHIAQNPTIIDFASLHKTHALLDE